MQLVWFAKFSSNFISRISLIWLNVFSQLIQSGKEMKWTKLDWRIQTGQDGWNPSIIQLANQCSSSWLSRNSSFLAVFPIIHGFHFSFNPLNLGFKLFIQLEFPAFLKSNKFNFFSSSTNSFFSFLFWMGFANAVSGNLTSVELSEILPITSTT